MEIDRLNKWLTLVANLGVLAGLLFLAFEIRQSNRIAIASNELEVRNSYTEHNRSVYTNRDLVELFAKMQDPSSELTEVEAATVYWFALNSSNIWTAVETGYKNGVLPRSTFNEVEDDIRAQVKYWPAYRPILRDLLDDYPAASDSEVFRMINHALEEFEQ